MGRMHDFRRHFMAWWEGEELLASTPEPPADAAEAAAGDAAAAALAPPPVPTSAQPGGTRHGGRLWNLTRAELAEKMWGAQHHLPGGDALILDLIKPFGLDSTQQLLDFSAGFGGSGRAVQKATGAWVRGLEPAAELVEIGQQRLKKDGVHKHIALEAYDPETYIQKSSVDAVLVRDLLFTVQNKAGLFDAVATALKPGGMLAFTDYAAKDASVGAGLQAWLDAEPQHPTLLTMAEIVAHLKTRVFQVRINEDVTDHHRDTILEGLQHLLAYLQDHDLDPDTRRTVMAEIAMWRGRLQAFEHGLRMYRFFAIKR